MAKILSSKGFKAKRTKGPQGQPYVKSEVDDHPFEVRFYNCNGDKECRSIQFTLGFKKTSKTSLELINGWNTNVTMSSAYLVEEGAVLQLSVPIAGGVTKELLENQLSAWKAISSKFEEVVTSGLLK